MRHPALADCRLAALPRTEARIPPGGEHRASSLTRVLNAGCARGQGTLAVSFGQARVRVEQI